MCDYNRDGDTWRSPWSNEFEDDKGIVEDDASGELGTKPSDRVRVMEIRMGEAVDVYRDLSGSRMPQGIRLL